MFSKWYTLVPEFVYHFENIKMGKRPIFVFLFR